VAGRRRPEISSAPAARGGAPGGCRPHNSRWRQAAAPCEGGRRPTATGREHPCPWLACPQPGLSRRCSASHRQELDHDSRPARILCRARPPSMGVARSPGGGDAEEKNRGVVPTGGGRHGGGGLIRQRCRWMERNGERKQGRRQRWDRGEIGLCVG
jgi:hypothetical protein